jgi:hypothetical protein
MLARFIVHSFHDLNKLTYSQSSNRLNQLSKLFNNNHHRSFINFRITTGSIQSNKYFSTNTNEVEKLTNSNVNEESIKKIMRDATISLSRNPKDPNTMKQLKIAKESAKTLGNAQLQIEGYYFCFVVKVIFLLFGFCECK